MQPFPVDSADGDRHEAIGVAVKVALIVDGSSIAAGKDKDAALASSALLHAVEHGLDDESTGCLHRTTVVGWTPGARVDVVRLVAVVERRGLVGIGDGSGEDADTGDTGLVGDSYAANVVLGRCDFAGASSSVLVVGEARFGESGVVVVVPRSLGVL